jgi:uncharacterized membrane protein YozB (DUF420 family)
MLDVVVVAMVGVLVVLAYSLWLVRYRGRYQRHMQLQFVLAAGLLVVVGLFETEIRIHGWRHRAESSPFYNTWVMPVLVAHLVFSISTCVLWAAVMVAAIRHFGCAPRPGRHSRRHRFWGRLAALDMLCTTISGWLFYWLAFAAS